MIEGTDRRKFLRVGVCLRRDDGGRAVGRTGGAGRGLWLVCDGKELSLASFRAKHARKLFQIEGAAAASPEDGDLVAAFVRRAITIERFRDGERFSPGLEGGDQRGRGPWAKACVSWHRLR